MATTVADLQVRVSANTKPAEDALQRVQGAIGKAPALFQAATGAVAGFVTGTLLTQAVPALIDTITSTVGDFITQAEDGERVQGQLNAVLKSTGGIAGVSAGQVNDLATKMMNLSGVDDEAVTGAESMLLTFTNIRRDVFPATTRAVMDMATAMNGGAIPSADQLRQTAVLVGKALQDPTKGVIALRRVGVQLSAQQDEQVKKFLAVGDAAGAQKVILGELAREFGGSAAAAGQTFQGKLALVQQKLDNVKQAIGARLLPILSKWLDKLTPLIDKVANALPGALDTVQKALGPVVTAISDFTTGLMNNKPLMDGLKRILQDLAPLIKPIGIALAVLAAVQYLPLALLVGTLIALGLTLKTLWEQAQPVRDLLQQVWEKLAPLRQAFVEWAQAGLANARDRIQEMLPYVRQFLTDVQTRLVPIVNNAQEQLRKLAPVFAAIASWLSEKIPPALRAFQSIWNAVWPSIQGVVSAVWSAISGIVKVALDLMGGDTKRAGADFQAAWRGIGDGIKQVLMNTGKQLLQVLANIPGPIGDMARAGLDKIAQMEQQAAATTTKMKLATTTQTVAMAQQNIANLERQRVGVLAQLQATKDPAKRHMLEMRLESIKQAEAQQRDVVNRAMQQRTRTIAEYQKQKEEAARQQQQMKAESERRAREMADQIVATIGQMKDRVLQKLADLAKQVPGALASLPGKLADLGGRMMQALADAIRNGAAGVGAALGDALRQAAANLPGGIRLPGFASGGDVTASGLYLVGERGPELMALPAGARVYNAGQTRALLRGAAATATTTGGGAGAGAGGGGGLSIGAVHIYASSTEDGTAIWRRVREAMRREEMKRNGR